VLKATIAELIQATGLAERAIAGLKLTVKECDQGLGERLRAAEQLSATMDKQIDAGEALLERFSRLVAAAAQPKVPDAKSIAAAAQAFTDRARSRAQSLAA
jgi:hypothetical protein